ncbi:hypothetical protein GGS26DRAFT_594845 [Hypomontagnella submonticulosa]|nr:hypothetical protein GGS26DRAFT_594845 [Hypomontagnella submonticulosa]
MPSLWHRGGEPVLQGPTNVENLLRFQSASAQNADFLIRCGHNYTIWVHSDIVCARSEWFREKVEEARRNGSHVLDSEEERHYLYDAIATLYSGTLPERYTVPGIDALLRGFGLWAVADRLNLQSIKVALYRECTNYLKGIVCEWQRMMNFLGFLTEDLVAMFRVTMNAAYDMHLVPFQKLHVRAVKDAHFWVVDDPVFRALSSENQQFFQDVENSMFYSGFVNKPGIPQKCDWCEMDPLSAGWHYAKVWADDQGQPAGNCYVCETGMVEDGDDEEDDEEGYDSDGSDYGNWELHLGDD